MVTSISEQTLAGIFCELVNAISKCITRALGRRYVLQNIGVSPSLIPPSKGIGILLYFSILTTSIICFAFWSRNRDTQERAILSSSRSGADKGI